MSLWTSSKCFALAFIGLSGRAPARKLLRTCCRIFGQVSSLAFLSFAGILTDKLGDSAAQLPSDAASIGLGKKSKLKTESLDYSEEIREAIETSAQVTSFTPGERLDAEGVMKLIEACDPADARLVDLRYFGGFSHKEIGQFVALSEGAVHMRIHRALEAATAAITKGERYV